MTGIEVAQNALMNINSYKYLYGAKGVWQQVPRLSH